jgi:hypothetical protein
MIKTNRIEQQKMVIWPTNMGIMIQSPNHEFYQQKARFNPKQEGYTNETEI